MDSYQESLRWMKDARDCYRRSQRCFSQEDWRGTVQNAQFAIGLSVRAIIAFFEEPDWTHRPDGQLRRIVEERREEMRERFDQKMIDTLLLAAEDVRVAAPWHGWSVYGKPREDGMGWMPAVDLCGHKIALDLMNRAERTMATVERFFSGL